MRTVGILVMGTLSLLLLAVPAGAGGSDTQKYQIDKDSIKVDGPKRRDSDGKIVYTVKFNLKMTGVDLGTSEDEIVFRENGKVRHREKVKQVTRDLTTVLAMDISGSMARTSNRGKSKMAEAQAAAHVFFNKLHGRANAGLILFDDEIQKKLAP